MSSAPSASIPPAVQSQLLQHAADMATRLAGPADGDVTVVSTARHLANSLAFGMTLTTARGHPDRTSVYLVQVTGSFAAGRGISPMGGVGPTGKALLFTVDRGTNQILDWGVSPTPLGSRQLAELGTPVVLRRNGN